MTPRQTAAVNALRVLRNPNHKIAKFEVEEVGTSVMVSRYYGPANLPELYFDIHIIGVRGGMNRTTFNIN